ncbi:MAG: hypothetical protein VXW84_03245 [Verrucomicrobiota bacterium]|nr:hypothetical protein [Verrucomicrobiota bacterium]
MKKTRWILTLCLGALLALFIFSSQADAPSSKAVKATVKVAAVQISGYDKPYSVENWHVIFFCVCVYVLKQV